MRKRQIITGAAFASVLGIGRVLIGATIAALVWFWVAHAIGFIDPIVNVGFGLIAAGAAWRIIAGLTAMSAAVSELDQLSQIRCHGCPHSFAEHFRHTDGTASFCTVRDCDCTKASSTDQEAQEE